MTLRRTVIFGATVTLALAAIFFLVDRAADPVINEVEVVLQPCSHGGVWNGKSCDCVGPWGNEQDDPYCNTCVCANGQCDQNNVNVPFSGTLWGCRCEGKWMGPLCDVCFAVDQETCEGECLPGYGGSRCQFRCNEQATYDEILLDAEGLYEEDLELILSGGRVSACSGHGACRDDTKQCECQPNYYESADKRSSCARTCPRSPDSDAMCYGHGQCGENNGVVACQCDRGWHLQSDCSLGCPGMELPYVQEPCSGRGVCSAERTFLAGVENSTFGLKTKCDCNDLYLGEACQYKCPTSEESSSVRCNGHGECSLRENPFPLAQCSCEPGWTGKACQCNDATTCHGHGACIDDPSDPETFGNCACDEHWQGAGCNECVFGRWGSQCQFECLPNRAYDPDADPDADPENPAASIGCNGNGVCVVTNFARADERVQCGCTGNYDSETACLDCKDGWYPKRAAAELSLATNPDADAVDPAQLACSVRASRATCNQVGNPSEGYGVKGQRPCDCDNANADGWSQCSRCLATWFPDGDMSDPEACTKRCVDASTTSEPVSIPGVFTLVCKNGGTCDPVGDKCVCPQGFTGITCEIECGDSCSGHGQCVTDILQQFLAPEIKNSVGGGTAYRCECDPITSVSDEERLSVFSGDEIDFGGETVQNTYDYFGATCQHSCMTPPWRDAEACNGQQCSPSSIKNNDGNVVLECVRDDECGEWNAEDEILEFLLPNGAKKISCDGTEADTSVCLTAAEKKLRGMISLQTRWTDTMGPFCHVPNMPLEVHRPLMGCVERINPNAKEEKTEAECEAFHDDRDKCVFEGKGRCKYVDTCEEALDDYDVVSYCHEIMRTERPAALRSESCTSACDTNALKGVDWSKICLDFEARVPEKYRDCTNHLDDVCQGDAYGLLPECAAALPSKETTSLDAADGSALCFEISSHPGSLKRVFSYDPILDTPEAREMQAGFHPMFSEFEQRHECTRDVDFDLALVDMMQNDFHFDPAKPVYRCRQGDAVFVSLTDVTTDTVFCEVLVSETEINPFVLRCLEGDRPVTDMTYEDALALSLEQGCSLRAAEPESHDLYALRQDSADATCNVVLHDVLPDECTRVCGEDVCAEVGTTKTTKLFQCRRPNFSDVSPESCLMGVFTRTGGFGGAEYMCAVPLASIEPECSVNYGSCFGTLVVRVDELSESTETVAATTMSVVSLLEPAAPAAAAAPASDADVQRREFQITKTDVGSFVKTTLTLTNVNSFFRKPYRAEFDLEILSLDRGRLSVDGETGDIASILLHYYSSDVWHLNDEHVCEEEQCTPTTAVEVSEKMRVVVEWTEWQETAPDQGYSDVVATVTRADGTVQVQKSRRNRDVGGFKGFTVSGPVKATELYAFRNPGFAESKDCASDSLDTCTALARRLPESFGQDFELMDYCARKDVLLGGKFTKAFNPDAKTLETECTDTARADAVFLMPWSEAAAYSKHLKTLGDCDAALERDKVVQCEPVLSHFDTVACAEDAATNFDWERDYCQPLEQQLLPKALEDAKCFENDECLALMRRVDFADFCGDRNVYWDENGDERPKIPKGCQADADAETRWRETDWPGFCMSKARNLQKGSCAVAKCDCNSQGNSWLSGNACELQCPVGSTNSCCNEAALAGQCDYLERDEEAADRYYKDGTLMLDQRASEIEGRCRCSNPAAISADGCDSTCKTDDDEPLCNNRTYVEDGEEYQISACSAAGTGSCACLPPLTRQVQINTTSWDGLTATVTAFEYGEPKGNYSQRYRARAAQGPESLMINFFGYEKSTWKQAREKFELNPASFDCDGRPCDFHDVVLAQSLFLTSAFWGPECAQRCPGVDTGERMVSEPLGCDADLSSFLQSDRMTVGACHTLCLDSWRCNAARFNELNSFCTLFENCLGEQAAEGNAHLNWTLREMVEQPNFTPCTGRGRCTETSGQCVCDSARYLSISNPITQKRQRIQSDKRGFLADEVPVTTLDLSGWRGLQCELQCPGYSETEQDMATVCSNHGVCSREATCQCESGYTGVNCELKCPQRFGFESETTVCSGHGTCFEARKSADSGSTEREDVQRNFAVQEAWRKWYNECGENTVKLDSFVLPYGDFPGTVASDRIRGGPDCIPVPQVDEDDPTKPFVERPEIEYTTLTDFVLRDTERDMDYEPDVKGRSDDSLHAREGEFRVRYWPKSTASDGEVLEWHSELLFDVDFVRTVFEDKRSYDRFNGYSCGGYKLGERVLGLETAGACAQLCERTAECECFDYQEYYHASFLGGCRLAARGPLEAYPIVSVLQLEDNMGILSPNPGGEPVPFDAFGDVYVPIQRFKSCNAPTALLGSNVVGLTECATLCAQEVACTFFSYNARTLRCLEVRTESASCPEGFSTDPSGFYASVVADQGAAAPVAFVSDGSARVFPKDKSRGTLDTKQTGRGRPGYQISVAQCLCADNYALGHWAGAACNTCARYWGTKTCSKPCPGLLIGGEPCFGRGSCLYGSKNGNGQEFYNAICLCGDPAAPSETDLTLTGTWEVEEFELYVKSSFTRLTGTEPYYLNPNNYNFVQDGTCRSCEPEKGGLNCASSGTFCFYGGYSVFAATTESVSVPCQCTNPTIYDTLNACCPLGWKLSSVSNEMHKVEEKLQTRRLLAFPGDKFYDGVFYDDVMPQFTSTHPSRRYCEPCPNVYENNWEPTLKLNLMEDPNLPSTPCAGKGTCGDLPRRRITTSALPPRYFPNDCSELPDEWQSSFVEMWLVYPNKVLLDVTRTEESELEFLGEGDNAVFGNATSDAGYDHPDFVASCQTVCLQIERCQGFVLKEKEAMIWCYPTVHGYLRDASPAIRYLEPDARLTAYARQTNYDVCRRQFADGTVQQCTLGSVMFGDIVSCAEVQLLSDEAIEAIDSQLFAYDAGEPIIITFKEFGKRCKIVKENGEVYGMFNNVYGVLCDSLQRLYDEITSQLRQAEADRAAYTGTDQTEIDRLDAEVQTLQDRLVDQLVGQDEVALQQMQQYASNADVLAFGAYNDIEFQASVHKMPTQIPASRPDNICDGLPGGDYYWNPDNRLECIDVASGRTCRTHDWLACENNVIVSSTDTLHSHHEHAELPHKLLFDGKDREALVVLARLDDCADPTTLKKGCGLIPFYEKWVDKSALEDRVESAENNWRGPRIELNGLIGAGRDAPMTEEYMNSMVTSITVNCYIFAWGCHPNELTVDVVAVPVQGGEVEYSYREYLKAVKVQEYSYNFGSYYYTAVDIAQFKKRRYEIVLAQAELLAAQVAELKKKLDDARDSLANLGAQSTCETTSKCDMCARNCESDDECREGLKCVAVEDMIDPTSKVLRKDWFAQNNYCGYGDIRKVSNVEYATEAYDVDDNRYVRKMAECEYYCDGGNCVGDLRCLPRNVKEFVKGCYGTNTGYTGFPAIPVNDNIPSGAWVCHDYDKTDNEDWEPGAASYCVLDTINKPEVSDDRAVWDHRVYLVGYVSEPGVYSTVFVRVDDDHRVVEHFAPSRHALQKDEQIPKTNWELVYKRRSEELSYKEETVTGVIYAEGMSGKMPREGLNHLGLLFGKNEINQERGFDVDDAEACARLCDKTPGCTAAEYKLIHSFESSDVCSEEHRCTMCQGHCFRSADCLGDLVCRPVGENYPLCNGKPGRYNPFKWIENEDRYTNSESAWHCVPPYDQEGRTESLTNAVLKSHKCMLHTGTVNKNVECDDGEDAEEDVYFMTKYVPYSQAFYNGLGTCETRGYLNITSAEQCKNAMYAGIERGESGLDFYETSEPAFMTRQLEREKEVSLIKDSFANCNSGTTYTFFNPFSSTRTEGCGKAIGFDLNSCQCKKPLADPRYKNTQYVVLKQGTCAFEGYSPITTYEECFAAHAKLGHTDWGLWVQAHRKVQRFSNFRQPRVAGVETSDALNNGFEGIPQHCIRAAQIYEAAANCQNTEGALRNYDVNGCTYYEDDPSACGTKDGESGFDSNKMCCVCGGGYTPPDAIRDVGSPVFVHMDANQEDFPKLPMFNPFASEEICSEMHPCVCKVSEFRPGRGKGVVAMKRPDACELCKKRGMENYEIASPKIDYGVSCIAASGEKCDVNPRVDEDDPSRNTYTPARCGPAPRAGAERMFTATMRVGETFALNDTRPYAVLKNHPEIESPDQCEAFCVDDLQCKAWHYFEITLHDKRACELFAYVPVKEKTASELENVFFGDNRIGEIEREFSGFYAYMDDGSASACECDDPDAGYTCRCDAASSVPFKPNEPSDDVWGCSGHGVCDDLDYKCVCDDGYEWRFDLDQADPGSTCRACKAGTFSSRHTRSCQACPPGKYNEEEAAASCKECPSGKTTMYASRGGMVTGGKALSDCEACPAGTKSGETVGCEFCAVGSFSTERGSETCSLCPEGYTTYTHGATECEKI